MLVIFVFSIQTLGVVQARTEDPAVTVEVDGFQWQWTFRYLDDDQNPDNDYSITGSAAQPPSMVLPVGVPVRLILNSEDVIHSFYVPNFLIKRDLMPAPEGQRRTTSSSSPSTGSGSTPDSAPSSAATSTPT